MPAPCRLEQLLQETITKYVSAGASVLGVDSITLHPGMSKMSVQRHRVSFSTAGVAGTTSLITKEADLVERRTFALLNEQGQRNVPFSHTLDLSTDAPFSICLQDVGDVKRPTSREPITDDALVREATALAAIHAPNRGRASHLAWLPRVDRRYLVEHVLGVAWRPHWENAVRRDDFHYQFGPRIRRIEDAAARLPMDAARLWHDEYCLTLIHNDINPSNVRVWDGQPYFIDWDAAGYGPLYIDLPHHFSTLDQAERYRRALAVHGRPIHSSEFAECYRIAARWIGFRYVWWTLRDWQPDSAESAAWVEHYFGLILD